MATLSAALAALFLVFSAHAATQTVDGITWTYTVSNGKTGKFYAVWKKK